VREKQKDAALILLTVPSAEVQATRLRSRGDDEEHVQRRLAEGAEEERQGRLIADAVVVNDDLVRATAEVAGIVDRYRSVSR
jgi:guanylate kinase